MIKQLRLLFITDSLHVGGAERHAVSLASAFIQQGHSVAIACSERGLLASYAEQAGVVIHTVCEQLVKRRLSLPFAQGLAKLLEQESYDIVHAHMYASAGASAAALSGWQPILVLTEHSEASWRTASDQHWSRWFYSKTKHIIAVSEQIKKRLIERDSVPSHQISVIMNSLLPNIETHESNQPACFSLFSKAPVIGVVARLQPEKGVSYFIEAAALIHRALPLVHFVIIGDGPLRQVLQERVISLDMQECVHFLGFRLNVKELMQRMDIVVIPSLSEGTPLVTLDAMASGVPIVASAVGGIPEQIRHQQEGLLVKPGNPQELGDALIYLLQNPKKLRQLSNAGRLRVTTHFQFSTMVRQVEAIYQAELSRSVHRIERR